MPDYVVTHHLSGVSATTIVKAKNEAEAEDKAGYRLEYQITGNGRLSPDSYVRYADMVCIRVEEVSGPR